MFTNSLKESVQSEIEIQGVDGDALLSLVQYCYSGKICKHNFDPLIKNIPFMGQNFFLEIIKFVS